MDIVEVGRMTSGFMAGDLETLLKEASIKTVHHGKMETKISLEHLKSALKIVQPIMKKEGFTEKP